MRRHDIRPPDHVIHLQATAFHLRWAIMLRLPLAAISPAWFRMALTAHEQPRITGAPVTHRWNLWLLGRCARVLPFQMNPRLTNSALQW